MKYIVMDVGGTFIKHAEMDENFAQTNAGKVPTEREPDAFLSQLVRVIKSHGGGFGGVALSMAGFINPQTGENTDFSCGERFTKYNFREKLRELTGYRISVENDSNCAALAEHAFGAGKGCSTMALMTVGTGIGGALIAGGKLYRGRNFKAGEFGFAVTGYELESDCAVPHCAAPRCAVPRCAAPRRIVPRRACATSALVKRCSEALGREVDGAYVFENLDGDARLAGIYGRWVADIAVCVGNVCVALDPEKFLVGGAVSAQGRFIDDLKTLVYGAFEHLSDYTKIERCAFGNDAGKVGALLVFFENYGK